MEIRVNEEDQLALLAELRHKRQQVTELQTANARVELENRDLRVIVRRLEDYPVLTRRELHTFEELPEELQAEFSGAEIRRSELWMRLRGGFGVYE
jgi:hypothetical protein